MNPLFDLIKTIFEKPKEYKEKVTDYDKRTSSFMISRFMSIQYPLQANDFNHIKINPARCVDVWQRIMSKMYSKTPGWIYTKTNAKKETQEKKKKTNFEPSEETIKFYLERYEMSLREYNDAKVFMKDDLYNELERIEKQLKDN